MSSFQELVTDLLRDYGVSARDIALQLRVSTPQLRRLRQAYGMASVDQVVQLQEFRSLLDTARSALKLDPAGWYVAPLLSGYTVTPQDLLLREGVSSGMLLALIRDQIGVEAVLDAHVPQWRERYLREWTVVTSADGMKSLVRMSDSSLEVRDSEARFSLDSREFLSGTDDV